MQPFAPRPIRFVDVRPHGPWRLKLYSVMYGSDSIDWDGFESGIRYALDSLPQPDAGAGRPGLGFIIAHQGLTGDYVVVGWWNHENELPFEIWIRRSRDEDWRRSEFGQSVYVWDLEIIWAERNAWIETMLGESGLDEERYLARVDARFRITDSV